MSTDQHNIIEHLKPVGDAVSISTLLAFFAGFLPIVATSLTILWMAIRIYETDTVQNYINKSKKTDD